MSFAFFVQILCHLKLQYECIPRGHKNARSFIVENENKFQIFTRMRVKPKIMLNTDNMIQISVCNCCCKRTQHL